MIYAIENLERFLMTLGKKCKVNLLSGHKLPTSRDFRIKSALVKEALTRKDDDDSIQETQVWFKAVSGKDQISLALFLRVPTPVKRTLMHRSVLDLNYRTSSSFKNDRWDSTQPPQIL